VSQSRGHGLPEPVHFIGIGGAGMSAIALVLARLGVRVTGSDLKASRYTRLIEVAGVGVCVGHDEANLGRAALVVISSAVPESNVELAEARRRGLPVLQRAEMLARIMAMRRGIAVAGTHGKTTTSSMIAHVLHECGCEPTFLIGGEVNDRGSNAGVGEGEWLVAEADESDGSLLYLRPEVAVITNVELDHHSHYACVQDVHEVFRRFVALLPAGGRLVLVDGGGGEFLAADSPAPVTVCGLLRHGDAAAGGDDTYRAAVAQVDDTGSDFTVLRGAEELARVRLRVPGEHNVLNALCALAVLEHAGVTAARAAPPLSTFSGAGRRFQETGRQRGVLVVDDYAHHPSELAATLRAAMLGDHQRVIAVFQPHLFSRTRYLQREFGRALTLADEAVVTDVFAAREEPEPGITGKLLVDAYLVERPGGPVSYMPRLTDVVRHLSRHVRPGDLVLTLGAGDVFRAGEELLTALRAQGEDQAGGE
jgi:UDP-N-acetylmuramate--alanine ligase